jgi:PhnB protein
MSHSTLNAYLTFPGTCDEALKFYEQTFHATREFAMTHGESPMKDQVEPEWRDKIIHASLRIGDSVLMASDAPPNFYKKPQGFAVSITLSVEEAERVFPLLAEGGRIEMPIQKTFWAERFGSVNDRFGTPWMVTGGHDPE